MHKDLLQGFTGFILHEFNVIFEVNILSSQMQLWVKFKPGSGCTKPGAYPVDMS